MSSIVKGVRRSRTVATVALFTALTVALNLSPVKIPAPYAPFLIYQVWEIPIVAAFILYGLRAGVAISIFNTLVLLAVFPGVLPTGPLYNLVAVLSMLIGVYIIQRLVVQSVGKHRDILVVSLSTGLGIMTRVVIMTIVNWAFLRYPPPVGFSIPVEALVAMLPIIGVFNATLALYTIPLGHLIAKAVRTGTKGTGRT